VEIVASLMTLTLSSARQLRKMPSKTFRAPSCSVTLHLTARLTRRFHFAARDGHVACASSLLAGGVDEIACNKNQCGRRRTWPQTQWSR
jgi:hypothetical protein